MVSYAAFLPTSGLVDCWPLRLLAIAAWVQRKCHVPKTHGFLSILFALEPVNVSKSLRSSIRLTSTNWFRGYLSGTGFISKDTGWVKLLNANPEQLASLQNQVENDWRTIRVQKSLKRSSKVVVQKINWKKIMKFLSRFSFHTPRDEICPAKSW